MIDNFSILLSHGLLLFMFWLLINRQDLNNEAPPTPDVEPEGFAKKHTQPSPPVKSDPATDTDYA